MTHQPRYALLSVSDKTNLDRMALALTEHGFQILSTGGTARYLSEHGIAFTDVSAYTNFPEMMDGRVKTLHPKIHGGILAVRSNEAHQQALHQHDIGSIDVVVVNLYPFEQTIAKTDDQATCIEMIDIGGPTLVRAAAKNFQDVTVIVAPEDYDACIKELENHQGSTTLGFRQKMASKAFQNIAAYDQAIAHWLSHILEGGNEKNSAFSETLALNAQLKQVLRYGENAHQKAAFYHTGAQGLANAEIVQGKALSYNNLNDADAALKLVSEFEQPACAIIKHANPCGVALGTTILEAYNKALACDPLSAFGGIVALNRPLEAEDAKKITEIFTEVVIAPSASEAAKTVFAQKKNLRLLLMPCLTKGAYTAPQIKSIAGGYLVQDEDVASVAVEDLEFVTKAKPEATALKDVLFASIIAKHVKSNAIVFVRDQATIGIGAGQMSRVDSARIAAHKMQDAGLSAETHGPFVGASDAFFPFEDGVLQIIEAGANVIVQPGGSKRDTDIIKAVDEKKVAMVLTGQRHFRH